MQELILIVCWDCLSVVKSFFIIRSYFIRTIFASPFQTIFFTVTVSIGVIVVVVVVLDGVVVRVADILAEAVDADVRRHQ